MCDVYKETSSESSGKENTNNENVHTTFFVVGKAVVLMYDTYGKEETTKALPEIIKYLKEQGYEFRTMK